MYNRYIQDTDGKMKKEIVQEPIVQIPVIPQATGNDNGLTALLSSLLPSNLDNTDILIAVLLLLISGGNEPQSSALLTLAFYLFM